MIVWLFWGAIGLLLIGLVIYWAVVLTEGAYLGPRVVRAIYDWGAATYDDVKQYVETDEFWFLGYPLAGRLEESTGRRSFVLDVATGTARLPLALCRVMGFEGQVVGLDLSRRMLAEAERKTAGFAGRVTLVHHPAAPLPFGDGCFDAVTMLEALEFVPDPDAVLREIVRVLVPGGLLLLSNRIGRDALWLPGRAPRPERFEAKLRDLGLVDIQTKPWQEYYDLIWARKPGNPAPRVSTPVWHCALRCPVCATVGRWQAAEGAMACASCGSRFVLSGRVLELTQPLAEPLRT